MSPTFAERLLSWQASHGRHDLPWQTPRQPYRVWVSEIMLQQTQVTTVIPYFQRFIERFPDVQALAEATLEEVNQYWAGLGYYRRARFLHQAARVLLERYGGVFPETQAAWTELPGIGRSTAAAIVSQAFDQPAAILDGNVKRVLCRVHALTLAPGSSAETRELWRLAELALPERDGARYTQAIMDLGATLCLPRAPRCVDCPVQALCAAYQQGQSTAYPLALRKKRVPTRHAIWLLIRDAEGRVMLTQRPPTGVWPALWCLPEAESIELVTQQFPNASLDDLGEIRHTFTHFRLRARLYQVKAEAFRVEDRNSVWLALDSLPSSLHWPAMPAPVKKLLLALNSPKVAAHT